MDSFESRPTSAQDIIDVLASAGFWAYLSDDRKGFHLRLPSGESLGQSSSLGKLVLAHRDEILAILNSDDGICEAPELLEKSVGDDGLPKYCLTEFAWAELKKLEPTVPTLLAPAERFISFGLYESDEYGVRYRMSDDKTIILCGPVEVRALSRDSRGEDAGVLLRWVDVDNRTHDCLITYHDLISNPTDAIATLASKGLRILAGKNDLQKLAAYFQLVQVPGRARTVACTGWNHSIAAAAFVLPDTSYGGANEVFRLKSPPEANPYKTSGTLSDWQREVGALCVGNARLTLAASTSFAAPLLDLVGLTGIGVHFVGPSQRGKTSAAKVAASVCGGKDYLHSWKGTDNSFESRAVNHCDGPFILDEIGLAPDKSVGDAIYAIVNGRGKGRSNRDGSHKKEATWRVAVISTGEMTLEKKMADAGQKVAAGQEVRLLNIAIDENSPFGMFGHIHGLGTPREFADKLRAATEAFYGTPFRAFVLSLVCILRTDPDFVARRYKVACDLFLKHAVSPGSSPQIESAAKAFALIAMAGELASDLGITGWAPRTATFAAAVCFKAWLAKRGGIKDHEIERGMKQVGAFLAANGNSRFDTILVSNGKQYIDVKQKTVNRVGFRRRVGLPTDVDGHWEYLILAEAWDREVCKDYDGGRIAREMIKQGRMKAGQGKRKNTIERIPGEGPMRVHVIFNNQPTEDAV